MDYRNGPIHDVATLKSMISDTNLKINDRKIHLSRTLFDLPYGDDGGRLIPSMRAKIADLITCRDNLIKDLDRLSSS